MTLPNKRILKGAAFALCSLAFGCQTYDFEPIEPFAVAQTTKTKQVIAKRSKPNLMLVVDKSGSMSKEYSSPAPSRWSELRSAMVSFLNSSGSVARMGMMAFPADNKCTPPSAVRVNISQSEDVESELASWASSIRDDLLRINDSRILPAGATADNYTVGGTPTAGTLDFLASYSPLIDKNRDNVVLLLTDGLPNCQTSNVLSCQAQNCTCTTANGCNQGGTCDSGSACLDKDAVVASIAALKTKQIRTIVVGFGAETAGADAFAPLNAMAEAGGFALNCPNGLDSECGSGNACDKSSKKCTYKYYKATNATELSAALTSISQVIAEPPCESKLDDVPADPRFISVYIDGQPISNGSNTWNYANGKVVFVGDLCRRLENSTVKDPVNVEIRLVQAL